MVPKSRTFLLLMVSLLVVAGKVHSEDASSAFKSRSSGSLRIATTTSVENSGLLNVLLPAFSRRYGLATSVIAVGSGAALAIAERGDCDLVISHAPDLEAQFMAKGLGELHVPFMTGDFLLLGPRNDPAGAAHADTCVDAFRAIAASKALFISRGDRSGTHQKELEIWANIKGLVRGPWYREAGQGMAEVLTMAEQLGAYTLSDRATWLAMRTRLPHLQVLLQGDAMLRTIYSVIIPRSAHLSGRNADGAAKLASFLTGSEGASLIAGFLIEGEPCFFPIAH